MMSYSSETGGILVETRVTEAWAFLIMLMLVISVSMAVCEGIWEL